MQQAALSPIIFYTNLPCDMGHAYGEVLHLTVAV